MAPAVAGAIVNGDAGNVSKWKTVWITAIVIFMVESLNFIVFADGKPQEWNAQRKEKSKQNKKDWFLVRYFCRTSNANTTTCGACKLPELCLDKFKVTLPVFRLCLPWP